MKFELEKHIRQNYLDAEYILSLIKKYEFGRLLAISIESIADNIIGNQLSQIPSTSCTALSHINMKLSAIENKTEKSKLEYLIAELFEELISTLPQTKEGSKTLVQLNIALKTCCKIGHYNYGEFSKFINIDNHLKDLPIFSNNNYSYQWNGKDWELDDLARHLKSKKIVTSVIEFRRLFKPIYNNHTFISDEDAKDKLFVLFHSLNKCGFIKPIGTSGHLKPLTNYAINQNGDYLYQLQPNKYHDKLKRDSHNYLKLKEFSIQVITGILKQSLGQWSDNEAISIYLTEKIK